MANKKNKRIPHKKNIAKKSELSNIEPIPASKLKFEDLHSFSSKRLLVTAIALNKKSKREKRPEAANAMNVLALGIKQILDGRMNIAAGKVISNDS